MINIERYGDLYRSAINVLEVAIYSRIDPGVLPRRMIDDLFLLVADFALLIPPPSEELVHKLATDETDVSVFQPLHRFTAACAEIDEKLLRDHSHGPDFEWVRPWLDGVSRRRGWPGQREVAEMWVAYLEYLLGKIPADVTLSWQLEAMKLRLRHPLMVLKWSAAPKEEMSLYDTIERLGAFMIYRTATGTQWRYFVKDPSRLADSKEVYEQFVRIITQRAVGMTVADHVLFGEKLACPIYGLFCDCGERTREEAEAVLSVRIPGDADSRSGGMSIRIPG